VAQIEYYDTYNSRQFQQLQACRRSSLNKSQEYTERMQGHDYNLKRIDYRNRNETKKRKSSLFAPVRPYK
jgi:hypothetical protein